MSGFLPLPTKNFTETGGFWVRGKGAAFSCSGKNPPPAKSDAESRLHSHRHSTAEV